LFPQKLSEKQGARLIGRGNVHVGWFGSASFAGSGPFTMQGVLGFGGCEKVNYQEKLKIACGAKI